MSELDEGSGLIGRRSILRTGLILGISLPAAAALAGCSTSEPGVSASGSSALVSTTPTDLSFWSRDSYVDGKLEPLLRARVAEFDRLNNTKTDLIYLNFADSTQKAQAAFATGSTPSIGQQGPDVSLQYAAGGHLEDLSDLYTKLSAGFVPMQKDAVTTWNGATYAIPWYLQVNVLYYHKDLLQQAGMQMPTTWDEWLAVSTALTRGKEQYGFVVAAGDGSAGQLWIPLATSAGGALLDESGMPTPDREPFIEALDFLNRLYKASMPEGAITYTAADIQQLFLLKKVASEWDNASVIPAMATAGLSDNLAAVQVPARAAGDTSRSFLGGFGLFVFAPAKQKDLSKQLIEFLYDPTFYGEYVKTGGGFALPVVQATADDPFFSEGLMSVLTKQAETSVRFGGPVYGNAPYLGQAEAEGLFNDAVVSVWSGNSTPQQSVEDFFTKLTALAKSP